MMQERCRFALGVALCSSCAVLTAGCWARTDTDETPTHAREVSSHGPSREQTPPAGVLPRFRAVGSASGLDFERYDDISRLHRILEVNGGGVALFDFDGDGWLDVFFTNGCRLPLNSGDRDRRGELFRNRGQMRFERVTGQSLLVQFGYTFGCAVGDYDADGFDDLYVTAHGRNALWHNNGDGTFTDAADESGTVVPQWSSSAAFADLNGDGHLDLYVVNYLDESDESPTLCPEPASPDGYVQCSPARFEGVDDVLFLSDGQGGFRDATAESGLAGVRGKGLGVVVSDFDADGDQEMYVANDGEPNFLFVQRGEHRREAGGAARTDAAGKAVRSQLSTPAFNEQALESAVALSESGYAQASMGVAAGDYDADGRIDLFLTHFFNDTNTLYANRGGLFFEDATRGSGLGPTSRRTLGWGTAFLDADNDGWLDLIVANGHIDDRTWMSESEPYRMRPQMYRNQRDGSFADVSDWSGDYFLQEWLGRGLALGDLDRDGRVDAVVSHQLAPSTALRNETPTDGASLTLRLVGTSSNRNGYGARVEVLDAQPTTVRELAGGGSFQSASAPEIHLGIGAARRATVRILWPSGLVETHADVPVGGWIAVEGQGSRKLLSELQVERPRSL